ncbi:MAG: glycosyltransferase involved in cell wall biosynthesis [Saprospiraceae bacterium]|jgi:glycosyltransferase involved in cell wall biosynthesis
MISRISKGWESTPEWDIPNNYNPSVLTSVIIAARNEEKQIKACLESILACDYPKSLLEIIVIDDASTDDTSTQVKSVKSNTVQLLHSDQNAGKKGALALGIYASRGDLIITTDADCRVNPNWLKCIVSYYQKNQARLIAAPIQYAVDKSLLQRFQYIDGINNMAVTANGILNKSYFMANGANLAYEKSLFNELNGFDKSAKIASGDDMHMVQSAADLDPSSVQFIKSKDAIVFTKAENDLFSLVSQRKRWSTKTKCYSDKRIIKIQGYVFFFISLLSLNLCLSFFGFGLSFFGLLFGLFIKLSIDYLYLTKLEEYFESKDALKSFLPASFMFLMYVLLAGWWALFPSSYEWKGRKSK